MQVFTKNVLLKRPCYVVLNLFKPSRLISISSLSFYKLTSELFEDQSSSINSPDNKRFKIYTRTGDKGKSSLFTGERRPKNDSIFDALGNTDELNSSLGLAREFCIEMQTNEQNVNKDVEAKLIKIQSVLLDIGSQIATPRTRAEQKQLDRLTPFDSGLVAELEAWIDSFDRELPVLKNFILPSGGKCASTLHLSRAICRRLERSVQPLLQSEDLDRNVCIYINRLSDFLFMCARYCSMKEKKVETIYKKS